MQTSGACLARRAVPAPLPVQEGHDRAKRAVQPRQAVAQADVGAHGRPVRVAVQVPDSAVCLQTSSVASPAKLCTGKLAQRTGRERSPCEHGCMAVSVRINVPRTRSHSLGPSTTSAVSHGRNRVTAPPSRQRQRKQKDSHLPAALWARSGHTQICGRTPAQVAGPASKQSSVHAVQVILTH